MGSDSKRGDAMRGVGWKCGGLTPVCRTACPDARSCLRSASSASSRLSMSNSMAYPSTAPQLHHAPSAGSSRTWSACRCLELWSWVSRCWKPHPLGRVRHSQTPRSGLPCTARAILRDFICKYSDLADLARASGVYERAQTRVTAADDGSDSTASGRSERQVSSGWTEAPAASRG